MKGRILVIGLDCLGPEVLASESLAELPNLRRLAREGLSGRLESTLPPITVPAWTSLTSGRDPGELGVYGFRNRMRYDYSELGQASRHHVRFPRLWDFVGASGGRSIVVGFPQTSPVAKIRGELVGGFDAPAFAGPWATPTSLVDEITRLVGDYPFDVDGFRSRPRAEVLADVYTMTEKRFAVMEHLMTTRAWDLAMVCEIGPDRLHHCFWSDHDRNHPRHSADSDHRHTIRRYYRYLDERVGRLLKCAGPECMVLVASDHGAQPMLGGVCVNEVLRRSGWLTLKRHPERPMRLRSSLVDWSLTRAWAEGGHYARIFLNLRGREPLGVVAADDRERAKQELTELLTVLDLPQGPVLENRVLWPERIYRRVRGLAPDLLVQFGDLAWRSLGTVGHDRIWQRGNDTGLDEANHSQHGLFILHAPGRAQQQEVEASILDLTPTLLAYAGLDLPADLEGRNLLLPEAA